MYQGRKVEYLVLDSTAIGLMRSEKTPTIDERALQVALSDTIQSESPENRLPWPYGMVNVVDIKVIGANKFIVLFEQMAEVVDEAV